MGEPAYEAKRPPTDGRVRVRTLPCSAGVKEHTLSSGDVNVSRLITDLTKDERRTDAIVRDLVCCLDHTPRYVMILSDRTKHLSCMYQKLLKHRPALEAHTRMLTGATKPKDREEALTARVIFTTFAFSQEGVDVPRLDTVVLASPKGDVVQTVGRALREHPDKSTPLILEYKESLESGILSGLQRKRMGTYKKHGFSLDEK
jgi:superfamily II DNA or RNA helicase